MSIINTIENSEVIKSAKAAYEAAKAAGDTAGMKAAHDKANAYRQEQGGYIDVYEEGKGTAFNRVITNTSVLDGAIEETLTNATNGAKTIVEKVEETIKAPFKDSTTVIDSSYDPSQYMPYNSGTAASGSSTSFDELLGYGVIALIAIAVLSRVVGGK